MPSTDKTQPLTAAERYDAAKRSTMERLFSERPEGDDAIAAIWREECIAAIEAAVSDERVRCLAYFVQITTNRDNEPGSAG